MKKILEWLEELPEPYRTQALENIDINFEDYRELVEDLESALLLSFNWHKSPQGHDYWSELHIRLC